MYWHVWWGVSALGWRLVGEPICVCERGEMEIHAVDWPLYYLCSQIVHKKKAQALAYAGFVNGPLI